MNWKQVTSAILTAVAWFLENYPTRRKR